MKENITGTFLEHLYRSNGLNAERCGKTVEVCGKTHYGGVCCFRADSISIAILGCLYLMHGGKFNFNEEQKWTGLI